MKRRTRRFIEGLRGSVSYWLSAARTEFTSDLDRIMRIEGITQSELAERMGTSQAYISKALGGESNFTIQSMVRLALAVGATLQIRLTRKGKEVVRVLDLETAEALEDRLAVHHFGSEVTGATFALYAPQEVVETRFPNDSTNIPGLAAMQSATAFPSTGVDVLH